MNIVYLLTNISKTEGRRYYIGSKQECQVVDVNGIPTMIGRDGKPYYSSSSSFELRQDVLNGDVLSVKILQKVADRRELIKAENEWILKLDAVNSDEYYNMTTAHLDSHNQDALANLYGETVKDLASNNSSTGKRDNAAKELGFANFGEMCFDIWENYKRLQNWAAVSALYNRKNRHWANVTLRAFDMEKAKLDVLNGSVEEVRKLVSNKCSLQKVGEILGLEYPAVRVLLGDFNKTKEKSYSVALLKGMSRGELEAEVTRRVLDGKGFEDVAKELGLDKTSTNRYFMRCIRRHLSSEDIVDVIPETEEEIAAAKEKRKERQKKIRNYITQIKQG